VIEATVTAHDLDDDLTTVSFAGGALSLSGQVGRKGQNLRVRIPLQDIILATQAPAQISARNVLPVTITAVKNGIGPGVVIGLLAGQTPLLARITKASLRDMNLAVGMQIFAIIKATAVAPRDING
jgi:molybdate transport system ATP-binding protein